MRKLSLVVLSLYLFSACTTTHSWKPLTSSHESPQEIDSERLVGKERRFLLQDSSFVELNVMAVDDEYVYGVNSNPYMAPDTMQVDLQNVLRIDYPFTFAKPNAMGWFLVGASIIAVAIVVIAIVSEPLTFN